MIIKVSPENDIERAKMGEGVEHTGVKEFFMFGNKKDKEGDLIDFHDWSGSYRYLEGSLYHFMTTITEEKITKAQQKANEIDLKPQALSKKQFVKKGKIDDNNLQVINVEEMVKGKKQEVEEMAQVLKFPPPQDEFIETPVNEENMQAEDKDEK